MYRTIKLLAVFGAATLLLMPRLFAGLSATLYYQADGQPSGYRDPGSSGGEFSAVLSGNSTLDSYILANYASVAKTTVTSGHTKETAIETFCVETTVTFTPGTTYNAAIGSSVVPGEAPIALGTAWLYMEFATGGLATYGYNYSTSGSARELSADELQDAIWYLQGETPLSSSLYHFNSSDPFLLAAEQFLDGSTGSTALNDIKTAATSGEYGVYALNLSTTDKDGKTVYAQDQLVYCPVPEPATVTAGLLLLLPLAASTFRILRQKRVPG
jgi:hypothetical protein